MLVDISNMILCAFKCLCFMIIKLLSFSFNFHTTVIGTPFYGYSHIFH